MAFNEKPQKKKKEKKPSPQTFYYSTSVLSFSKFNLTDESSRVSFLSLAQTEGPSADGQTCFSPEQTLWKKNQKKRKKIKEGEGGIDLLCLFKANYPLQWQFLLSMSCSSSLLITLRG